MTADVSGHDVH